MGEKNVLTRLWKLHCKLPYKHYTTLYFFSNSVFNKIKMLTLIRTSVQKEVVFLERYFRGEKSIFHLFTHRLGASENHRPMSTYKHIHMLTEQKRKGDESQLPLCALLFFALYWSSLDILLWRCHFHKAATHALECYFCPNKGSTVTANVQKLSHSMNRFI